MKTIHSQPCNVEMRDQNDRKQTEQLYRLVDKLLYRADLGVLTPQTLIYIPYQSWIENGGCGSVVPPGIKLVHGLDKPTINLDKAEVKRRRFLVSDQASATGYTTRVHMAAHHKVEGRIKIHRGQPYCGEAGTSELIAPSLEDVTCPECLQELQRINKVH